MPDLGKYAVAVLSAYGISLASLAVIIGMSVVRYRRVKAALDRVEQGRDG
jgi:heme exporter protein D